MTSETKDIKSDLGRLRKITSETPKQKQDEIVGAVYSCVDACLKGQVMPAQISALLVSMHFLALDYNSAVIESCARAMRENATPMPIDALRKVIESREIHSSGTYKGGFCDLVGTGGDKHNTFNISTTASIISSSFIMMAKHGNRASTSKSGSADLLQSMGARLEAVTPSFLPSIYLNSNYAFLFAPVFHPGMAHVGPVRKQLPMRTIFNLLGPLANPVNSLIEARVIGVARQELGPLFAEVYLMSKATKTLVVCGEENLDEISCAGRTSCWKVDDGAITRFTVCPKDFGLLEHPLADVAPGGTPEENAAILRQILNGEMDKNNPIMHFVLMNAATMIAMSGCCEETTEKANSRGLPGDVITETGPGGLRDRKSVV